MTGKTQRDKNNSTYKMNRVKKAKVLEERDRAVGTVNGSTFLCTDKEDPVLSRGDVLVLGGVHAAC